MSHIRQLEVEAMGYAQVYLGEIRHQISLRGLSGTEAAEATTALVEKDFDFFLGESQALAACSPVDEVAYFQVMIKLLGTSKTMKTLQDADMRTNWGCMI